MAETRTGTAALTAVRIAYAWTVSENTTTKANMTASLGDLSITEGYLSQYVIAGGGNLTIPLGTIASCKSAIISVTAGSAATSAPTIEINNSGVTDAFTSYCASGGAGITQIEIINTDGANALTITVLVAE